MSLTKQLFAFERIEALIDKIINNNGILKESQSYHDLEWIKFYAKEMITKCEGCEEAPRGSENNEES